jgi:hypothetical protein
MHTGPLEDGREAVHRDQHRGSADLPPPVELGFDPIMVWPENLAYACDLLAFTQPHISRYRRELADFQDRRLGARPAVAVDDKARIVPLHQVASSASATTRQSPAMPMS